MFKAEKILWGEGLFLRPQHFQLQDRYHEQRLNHTIHATIPFAYGVQSLLFDESQLSNHVLALQNIKLIWQDGEIYHAPAQDLLPEAILLDEMNLNGEMLVYLTLPIVQPNKHNVAHDTEVQASRYHSHLVETHDLFTDASPAEITLLRRQATFKVMEAQVELQDQLDGCLYLPIAKIKRHS